MTSCQLQLEQAIASAGPAAAEELNSPTALVSPPIYTSSESHDADAPCNGSRKFIDYSDYDDLLCDLLVDSVCFGESTHKMNEDYFTACYRDCPASVPAPSPIPVLLSASAASAGGGDDHSYTSVASTDGGISACADPTGNQSLGPTCVVVAETESSQSIESIANDKLDISEPEAAGSISTPPAESNVRKQTHGLASQPLLPARSELAHPMVEQLKVSVQGRTEALAGVWVIEEEGFCPCPLDLQSSGHVGGDKSISATTVSTHSVTLASICAEQPESQPELHDLGSTEPKQPIVPDTDAGVSEASASVMDAVHSSCSTAVPTNPTSSGDEITESTVTSENSDSAGDFVDEVSSGKPLLSRVNSRVKYINHGKLDRPAILDFVREIIRNCLLFERALRGSASVLTGFLSDRLTDIRDE
ncbi:uncharacterized protein BJ171DRAFT_125992 [Polychytrium aggregatum]|uniref:uncharacterized protein n=1 Tax=Polychytrium aggregatum TaxID=110093 RepID=UPI0022FE6DDF|nr:uncharacterized protein BJ171DRAFT_125992 [Polychytrium aggregatum]KAI9203928.1 hypothetical protein BJ171DRAFT_125992 [Polychytrium aggregatum]